MISIILISCIAVVVYLMIKKHNINLNLHYLIILNGNSRVNPTLKHKKSNVYLGGFAVDILIYSLFLLFF